MDTGQIFQPRGQSDLCSGRLKARRFVVELSDAALVSLGIKLTRSYISPHHYAIDPNMDVAPRLPTEDHIRRGDFGEFLTYLLYTQIFGHEIPFSRLWAKPAPNATQQGADTVSVIVEPCEPPRPFTVEVKVRTGSTGSGNLLADIHKASEIADDATYLAAAWLSGLDKLDAHSAARRAYAYVAAHHLALRDGTPPEELPPYEHHAVIITGGADITHQTIESHWGDPPVKALSIVIVPGLTNIIDRVYSEASRYTAGDLLGTTSGRTIDIGEEPEPFTNSGLLTPIDSTDLRSWRMAIGTEPNPVIEAALWYLADHDGVARARALTAVNHSNVITAVLAMLLIGKDKEAEQTASDQSLSIGNLLKIVSDVLASPNSIDQDRKRIIQSRDEVLHSINDPVQRIAIRVTTEAICYRLDRQPQRYLATSGLRGQRIRNVGNNLYKSGIHALWPSQVRTIEAGLLSRPPRPFVMKIPTSGGKTVLSVMVAANVLDNTPGSRIVVLAPTRALVEQLHEDFCKLLDGTGIQVLTLHGELEISEELLTDASDLVTIMTPERFDLDWRRSAVVAELEPISDRISAVIVDEAHYLADSQRGTRLELVLSRVLRANILIVLASSQLGGLAALANWIDGDHAETDWQPAHHIRQVYYRSQEIAQADTRPRTIGKLVDEANITESCLTIVPKSQLTDSTRATKFVYDQGAALAIQFNKDGPVVLFSAIKRNIRKLADNLYERVKDDPPCNVDALTKYIDRLPTSAIFDRQLLLAGIGVHHRDISQHMRKIIEQAARQGDLRYLVCTSTLLEGIDFPTRTVLMIYPQWGRAPLSIETLRNLEGRAGRGGIYTSGRLVIFRDNLSAANAMLRLFRSELPPTASQLGSVLNHLTRLVKDIDLGTLEPFLLAAIAEAAITDGELRIALEKILGRSLYFAALNDIRKDALFDAIEIRAKFIRNSFSSQWLQVVYCTGLPLSTCNIIRDRLNSIDLDLRLILADEFLLFERSVVKPDQVIKTLLYAVCIDTPELNWPDNVEKNLVEDIAEGWLNGTPAHVVANNLFILEIDVQKVFNAISGNGPWLIGAIVGIVGYLKNFDYRDQARLHSNLELDRLRFGTNSLEAAELVKNGSDRSEASTLWQAYHQSGSIESFVEWVKDNPLDSDQQTLT